MNPSKMCEIAKDSGGAVWRGRINRFYCSFYFDVTASDMQFFTTLPASLCTPTHKPYNATE